KFNTYKERRQFIRNSLGKILDNLESQKAYPSDKNTTCVIKALDLEYIQNEWNKALDRRGADPEAAITSARSLLESVCKYILEKNNVTYDEKSDLPKLYNLAAKSLNLSPSQHTEGIFKEILNGCFSVVSGLGALRNKLGDAHGKNIKYIKPSQRHAQLAVNLAGATATFLLETIEKNISNED
ncbi:MAG: abortive phage resistance protein, partial [Candidatus Magasanikbacteria bacterium RIFOXYD2_FULL_36_9]